MSCIIILGRPDDTDFRCNPSGIIELHFTCPRCGRKNVHEIKPGELLYGFEVDCYHRVCVKENERPGFSLTFMPEWDERILGLSDRPLHLRRSD